MGEMLDKFLLNNKKDQNTISKVLYTELLLVEEEILKRKSNIEQAQTAIANNAINVKTIAEATKISRKTFYNNDLLNKLVVENSTSSSVDKEENIKLKEKLKDSESKLLKMYERDVDYEILNHQICKLQDELTVANKRIKSLESQHEEDLKKLNKPIIKKPEILS